MNLIKEQLFEVVPELKIGHLRVTYSDNKPKAQWIPTERGKSKSNEDIKIIQDTVTSIMKLYPSFDKVVAECENHYGKEIDVMVDGLNHTVDLFTVEGKYDVWIRFIPQREEYNLYIYMYDKIS